MKIRLLCSLLREADSIELVPFRSRWQGLHAIILVVEVGKSFMLPSSRKLRCSFALSPELIQALNEYSASIEVSRSVFVEEALWIYLGHLDRHLELDTKKPNQKQEALAA
ncbi:ribbon-helix-helix domain-containing protein [Microcoleus vaginatus]|uniref:ribbon-helix-helix domain-containing protein n=1 Tax=Microcoleus vaginatus TaxID=119532 RepID=UPI0016892925|nr:ribbon-helix-helix domain-containing protein [Microcoleus sp. FACHB-84]MBD2008009.1 ribbon-helix-helix domain-containing protein [Microcoleus sp. FACHB-45]